MTNALTALAACRPTDSTFADEWQAGAALLDRMLTEPADAAHDRDRRWLAAAGTAVAAAVALVLLGVALPDGAPGGPDGAAAATLRGLAIVAGSQGATVRSGQYAYVAQTSEQTATADPPILGVTRTGGLDQSNSEQWTSPDGRMWIYRALGRTSGCLAETDDPAAGYQHLSATARSALPLSAGGHAARQRAELDYADLSAAALAALPTRATTLAAYLRAHPEGQSAGVDGLFSSVGDLLRDGLAPPQLRAAALTVLANTRGLSVEPLTTDAAGRPATRVDLHSGHALESLFFNPRTSQIEEEQTTQGPSLYRSVISAAGIATAIPSGLTRCPASTVPPG